MKIQQNPDGTIKELPWQLRLGNALINCGMPIVWTAAAQWLYNTTRSSKDGRFHMPHTMSGFNFLTGMSCVDIYDQVWRFGIPTQSFRPQFELWPDKKGIGLSFAFWVPAPQAAMADDILRANMGHYLIDGPRIGKGAKFTRPWGVDASVRSFDQWMLRAIHTMIGGQLKAKKANGKNFVQKRKAK